MSFPFLGLFLLLVLGGCFKVNPKATTVGEEFNAGNSLGDSATHFANLGVVYQSQEVLRLEMGNLLQGISQTYLLTLKNKTQGPFQSFKVDLVDADLSFSIRSTCGTNLDAQSTCPVFITVLPNSTSVMRSSLRVRYENLHKEELVIFPLSHRGISRCTGVLFPAGKELAHPESGVHYFYSAVQHPDGKVTTASFSQSESPNLFRIVSTRVLCDGSLDPTYGNRGLAYWDLPDQSYSSTGNIQMRPRLLLLPDGKLLVFFQSYDSSKTQVRLSSTRILSTGGVDPSYGAGGWVHFFSSAEAPKLSVFYSNSVQVALVENGKVLVMVGALTTTSGRINSEGILVFKQMPSGEMDPAFATNGLFIKQDLLSSPSAFMPAGLLFLPDGKYALYLSSIKDQISQVLKLNADGSLFTPFAVNGGATLRDCAAPHPNELTAQFSQLFFYLEGKYYLGCGFSTPNGSTPFVIRLTDEGSPDPSYGTEGRVAVSTGILFGDTNFGDRSSGLLLLADKSLWVFSKEIIRTGPGKLKLQHVLANGVPDKTFGKDGLVVVTQLEKFDHLDSLLSLGDGRVSITVGSAYFQTPPPVTPLPARLMRLMTNGEIEK